MKREFRWHNVSGALFAAVALVFAGNAQAAAWPEKPVRVVVPFSPGGGTDIQARLLAKSFHDFTGQTFVVDNRAGASGLIGAENVVQAAPDGYTILFTTATIAVNTTLYAKRLQFNPVKDLVPVSWVTSAPLVLCVHPSVPAKSVAELIALAKKRPGYMDNAINTPGSTSHLAAEMLKQHAGIETVLVPFRGGGPAMSSLISGETDMLFATGPVAATHRPGGRIRALAVTTPKPSSAFPDLPTMNKFYPGFEADNWYAMFFPAGTPKDVVTKMNGLVARAVKTSEVRAFLKRDALDVVASSPEALGAQLNREIAKYAKVIAAGNIKIQ